MTMAPDDWPPRRQISPQWIPSRRPPGMLLLGLLAMLAFGFWVSLALVAALLWRAVS
jgi:hypothetical protein